MMGSGYDTTFNPSIAALGMPQTNELSVLGKTITDFGKVLQDNEDAELKRKALNTSIAAQEQQIDFNKAMQPKQLQEADLKIEGQRQQNDFNKAMQPKQLQEADLKIAAQNIANKTNELQYKSADELWRDKKAIDYLQSYITENGLKPEDMPAMLKNRELNPNQFIYKDNTGAEYDISPYHIKSAFDAISKQNLESDLTKAKIASEKADALYKDRAGQAALMNANTNMQKANNIGVTTKNLKDIATGAAATSELAKNFQTIGELYRPSIVGGLDSLSANALNTVGKNTKDTTGNRVLQAATESLKSLVKDIYNVKGNVSNKDMQRIDAMTPSVWDNEDTFKAKTIKLADDVIAGYKAKMATFNPQENSSGAYAEWAGSLAAVEAAKQNLLKKFDETGTNYRASLPQEYQISTDTNSEAKGARSIKQQTKKTPVKQWKNPTTGQIKILYSDGTTEIK